MIFETNTLKVCKEEYYRVGYVSKLNKYVLAIIIPATVWYEQYYEISEKEYLDFDLKALVKEIRKEGTKSNRFLFSEKLNENRDK